MSLEVLPDEVLGAVCDRLSPRSLHSFYSSCCHARKIVPAHINSLAVAIPDSEDQAKTLAHVRFGGATRRWATGNKHIGLKLTSQKIALSSTCDGPGALNLEAQHLAAFIAALTSHPDSMHQFVRRLQIQGLPVTSTITPHLAAWASIQHLHLRSCHITGDPFAVISQLPHLQHLGIAHCTTEATAGLPPSTQLCDRNEALVSLLHHLPACSSLTSLSLHDHNPDFSVNMVNALSTTALPALTSLQQLSLNCRTLSMQRWQSHAGDSLCHSFSGLTALTSLTLLYNYTWRSEAEAVAAGCKGLRQLHLGNVGGDAMDVFLTQMPSQLSLTIEDSCAPSTNHSSLPCSLASLFIRNLRVDVQGAVTWLPLSQLPGQAPLKVSCVECDLWQGSGEEEVEVICAEAAALAAHLEQRATGRKLALALDCSKMGQGWPSEEAAAAAWRDCCEALAPLEPFLHDLMPALGPTTPWLGAVSQARNLGAHVTTLTMATRGTLTRLVQLLQLRPGQGETGPEGSPPRHDAADGSTAGSRGMKSSVGAYFPLIKTVELWEHACLNEGYDGPGMHPLAMLPPPDTAAAAASGDVGSSSCSGAAAASGVLDSRQACETVPGSGSTTPVTGAELQGLPMLVAAVCQLRPTVTRVVVCDERRSPGQAHGCVQLVAAALQLTGLNGRVVVEEREAAAEG